MHQKSFKLDIKSVDDDGTFSGYASVTGNIDSDNEVIDKGAFKRTLDHSKGVVPILWQHDRTQPVGWNTEASEDGFGLAVKGKLMIDTEAGRYAQSFLKTGLAVGAKPGLSIGFSVPRGGDYVKDGVRHFKEVALKEYSIVTFQANELATATAAKAEDGDTDEEKPVDKNNEKSGRTISVATGEKIKAAMCHMQEAMDLHNKALGMLGDLCDQPYTANDVNQDNPVGGGKSNKAASDSDVDHSLDELLELVRSVVGRTKAA